jgi:serine/threonine protein phosphatase 1
MRRFVVGDIHGCAKSLRTLIESIQPQSDDQIIFLGDYVDRGPASRDVVDQLIDLSEKCDVVTLRGNHEVMLMGATLGGMDPDTWKKNGGLATISSYGGSLRKIPEKHIAFFQQLRPYYETENEIFVHACYDPALEMREQDDSTIYWTHLPNPLPEPHFSGKRVFVGHTPQPFGQVLRAEHLVCIDTYCFGDGFLSAMDLETGEVIQVNRHGHLRRDPLADFTGQLAQALKMIRQLVKRIFVSRPQRQNAAGEMPENAHENHAGQQMTKPSE